MSSPYQNLPANRFWKSGIGETTPHTLVDLYKKKFAIAPADKIATAGSCFAQHIARYMRAQNFAVMDVEPAPRFLPREMRQHYGFELYSARYGNIYTARQLLQLAQDAFSGSVEPADVWKKGDRYYDALRPSVEPHGFDSAEEALANRRNHLEKVRELFETMNIFVFTFGLTEAWVSRKTGRVYPTAPGTIAGDFDPMVFEFQNFGFNDVYGDFAAFRETVQSRNPSVRFLLTVSPVPLTATATEHHVLVATTYSKSVLRSAAGALAAEFSDIDYMPSYEIIATPWSKGAFYEPNLRSVTVPGVAAVMRVFFAEHGVEGEAPEAGGESVEEDEAANSGSRETRVQRRSRRKAERAARRKDGRNPESAESIAEKASSNAEGPVFSVQGDEPPRKSQKEICEDILLETFGS